MEQRLITRRQALMGALALGTAALGGCGQSSEPVLRLGALRGTVPAYLPGAFLRFVRSLEAEGGSSALSSELKLEVQSLGSGQAIAEMFLQWQSLMVGEPLTGWPGWVPFFGRREFEPTDWMLLGDRWLSTAVREGWVQKLALELDGTAREAIADPRWEVVMSGDGESDGKLDGVFGMPYRWGTTVLVYRKDKVDEMGGPITDWSDLWRSQLRGKVVLLDQAREVIGAVLKSLGQSYNAGDLSTVGDLGDRLAALHRQALFYSSTNYLQPLLLGDAWVAMGWSRDVLSVLPRRGQLAAVVPQSGSALWADLWVHPAADSEAYRKATQGAEAENDNRAAIARLRKEWVQFCWAPDIARRVTLQTTGASPQFISGDWGELEKDDRDSSSDLIRFPDANVLKKSEFLHPLNQKMQEQYRILWSSLGIQS